MRKMWDSLKLVFWLFPAGIACGAVWSAAAVTTQIHQHSRTRSMANAFVKSHDCRPVVHEVSQRGYDYQSGIAEMQPASTLYACVDLADYVNVADR